jgi:hypothetical protein
VTNQSQIEDEAEQCRAVRGPDWDHLAGFPPVPHLSALLGLILDLGLVRHRGASLSD